MTKVYNYYEYYIFINKKVVTYTKILYNVTMAADFHKEVAAIVHLHFKNNHYLAYHSI